MSSSSWVASFCMLSAFEPSAFWLHSFLASCKQQHSLVFQPHFDQLHEPAVTRANQLNSTSVGGVVAPVAMSKQAQHFQRMCCHVDSSTHVAFELYLSECDQASGPNNKGSQWKQNGWLLIAGAICGCPICCLHTLRHSGRLEFLWGDGLE